jgi:hypothetical protein
MFLMHELRGIFTPQDFRLTMALETFPLRDMAIPLKNMDMAPLTGHPSGNILPMIECPTFDLDIPFRFNVTGGATPYGTRNAFLLPSCASTVEMTDKTVSLVNGEVGSLNELGMTGRASRFHPPSQLAQMPSMRKAYILKYHISI